MGSASIANDELAKAEERLRRVNKLLTTKAAIAQTPKEQIWALNKPSCTAIFR